ncbi:MAG: HNH endonuclease [Syntrophorhabdales bacterium]|jgi:predicted HNH restriction endonuclease
MNPYDTYDLETIPEVKTYISGLQTIQPKMRAEHYRILQAQYQMPNHTANTKQIAHHAAIDGHYRVNLLYGLLGHMFCDATGFVPELRPDDSARWWAVWSVGHRTRDDGFLWEMRPQVVEALKILEWVQAAPVSEDTYRKQEEERTAKSLRSSEMERQSRMAGAPTHPAVLQVLRTEFQRNPDVVASVLFRAEGRCELCRAVAPFQRASDGSPYLEIHHIVFLSDGGEDTVRNCVSLCPNCHREVHCGKERNRHNKALRLIAEKAGSG